MSWSLNGSMAVAGTPSAITLATSSGLLPWIHLPSVKFIGSIGESPSAIWHCWHFDR